MSETIRFRGRDVFLGGIAESDAIDETRLEGESWLSMRNRTQPEREALKNRQEIYHQELKELLKGYEEECEGLVDAKYLKGGE